MAPQREPRVHMVDQHEGPLTRGQQILHARGHGHRRGIGGQDAQPGVRRLQHGVAQIGPRPGRVDQDHARLTRPVRCPVAPAVSPAIALYEAQIFRQVRRARAGRPILRIDETQIEPQRRLVVQIDAGHVQPVLGKRQAQVRRHRCDPRSASRGHDGDSRHHRPSSGMRIINADRLFGGGRPSTASGSCRWTRRGFGCPSGRRDAIFRRMVTNRGQAAAGSPSASPPYSR